MFVNEVLFKYLIDCYSVLAHLYFTLKHFWQDLSDGFVDSDILFILF